MSEQIGLWRATYTPGQWAVLGGPTSLVILRPAEPRFSAIINDFWEVVVHADSLENLVKQLAQYNVERISDFAAFFWHNGEMRSLVRGAPRVVDLDSGETLATGAGVQTWTESGFGDVRRVRVVMEPDVDPETQLRLPLVVGAVSAAAVDLDAEATVSSPQPWGAAGDSEAHGELRAVETAEAVETPEAVEPVETAEAVEAADESGAVRPPAGDVRPPADDGVEDLFGPPQTDSAALAETGRGSDDSGQRDWEESQGQGNQLFPPTEAFTPGFDPQHPPSGQPAPAFQPQGFASPQSYGSGPQPPAYGQGGQESWAPVNDQGHSEQSGEMVLAVACPQGHANAPEAQRCRRCGGPLQGQPRMVARPVMVLLRPSTGAPVEVDRTVLIGRSPQANRVARDQLPKLLTVPSPSHDISRTHVQVSPEGWDLVATDLHSTNGTLLIRPGHPEAERMTPGEPQPVYPGCVLDLGDGVTILIDHPA